MHGSENIKFGKESLRFSFNSFSYMVSTSNNSNFLHVSCLGFTVTVRYLQYFRKETTGGGYTQMHTAMCAQHSVMPKDKSYEDTMSLELCSSVCSSNLV